MDRKKILQKTNSRCGYCGVELVGKWDIDHIQPKYLGGSDDDENKIASCVPCNRWKSTYTIQKFRKEIQKIPERLERYSHHFRAARRFNILTVHKTEIKFYFETN